MKRHRFRNDIGKRTNAKTWLHICHTICCLCRLPRRFVSRSYWQQASAESARTTIRCRRRRLRLFAARPRKAPQQRLVRPIVEAKMKGQQCRLITTLFHVVAARRA